jgi:hypothetical protein
VIGKGLAAATHIGLSQRLPSVRLQVERSEQMKGAEMRMIETDAGMVGAGGRAPEFPRSARDV